MYGDPGRSRIIADLSRAEPAVYLSRRRIPGHWQVIDYEIAGTRGTLLSVGPYTQAPPVQIPLDAAGWHAISIGFFAPNDEDFPCSLRLRLTSDKNYVRWRPEKHLYEHIIERFWKYANLQAGDRLEVAQDDGGYDHPGAIAFIRLTPLIEEEVKAIQADRAQTASRRLIAMNDAHGLYYEACPTTAAEIEEWLEPYRDTDVKAMLWCVGGGAEVVTYPSQVAQVMCQETVDYPRAGDLYIAQSMQALIGQGIDPLRVACDYTHQLGIEFIVSQRMEAFACAPPFEEVFNSLTYDRHPEWRCVDRDGTPVVRLSYAYEGVRRLMLDIFHEVADYGIDGINPIFNRGAPFLLYETPLLEGFQAQFGQDPRTLDERDERWLRYRAGVMTDFMRQLRREMDQHGSTPAGKRLQIVAHVLHNEETNLFFGLDLATWVAEGLVDTLIAYPWHSHASDVIDLDYFARLCRHTGVSWYVDLLPRRMEPADYLKEAQRIYGAGADGICLWDTNGRDPFWREWAIVRQLGHREQLAQMDPADNGAVDHPLISLGGYRVDRYSPLWAY